MEKQSEERKQKELDREASQNEQIRETGQAVLDGNSRKHKVELLTVIGEIEGHESAPSHSKTTKYEHVLPKLALIEDDEEIEGLLILLNTVGGDVEAGLAIAEMIASLSIPTVSLVLGGCRAARVRPRPLRRGADHRGRGLQLDGKDTIRLSLRYPAAGEPYAALSPQCAGGCRPWRPRARHGGCDGDREFPVSGVQ